MKLSDFWVFLVPGLIAGAFVSGAIIEHDLGMNVEISPTSNSALTIKHCHPGDVAFVHDQLGGMMITTNAILFLNDFSMLNPGTNVLRIQTVCAGVTSKPTTITIILKREPPPPIISARRITMIVPEPPIPWSMKMPLPNAGNPKESYSDFTNRIQSGMRRSQ